jgi:hypothetical protein
MISISVISHPHSQQRYNTVGDYVYSQTHDHIGILVSACSEPDYEFLIALHEFVEAYLVKRAKISEEEITQFDLAHPDGEPGEHPQAPYREQHAIATLVERLMAVALQVDWDKYEAEISTIVKGYKDGTISTRP